MKIAVNREKCPQTHKCRNVKACPQGAVKQESGSLPQINEELCTLCGRCVKLCPKGAFEIVNV